MKQRAHYVLTGHMVRDICSKSAQERLLHRLHCVALVYYGFSASKVAHIFGDSPRAVSYWVERFKQKGLVGLHEESRPGRPSKLNADQMRRLQRFVRESETTSGHIKAEAVAKFILEEFQVVLATSQCWRILRRLRT